MTKYTTYNLWVIQRFFGCDINDVYTDKDEAEKIKDGYVEETYNHYRKIHKNMTDNEFYDYIKPIISNYKVISLEDAIDNKIEEAVDQVTIYNEDY